MSPQNCDEGPGSAVVYLPGTLEYGLLYDKLEQPRERVRRGNAHQDNRPRDSRER